MSHRRKRAREYLRVSQDRSGRARSVDEQHGDHEEDAVRSDWSLGEPYIDVNLSASRYARKSRGDFLALLADLDTDTFDAEVLILWESSRGSRRVSEWVELIELCEKRGVQIWVHTHQTLYDPANPRHRRSLLEDAVDSEYESAKSSARIQRSTRAAAEAGRPHGRLLYGFARVYDERGRYVEQVHHPEEAPVVREAAQRVVAGDSCYEIARDFNRRGLRRPNRSDSTTFDWSLMTVKRVVINPAYAGYRVHRGKIVGKGDWPAIIPETLWQDCVARLSDPRRKTIRDPAVKHLLTGAVQCDVCGGSVHVQKNRGYYAYICSQDFCVSVKTTWLEDFVVETLLRRLEQSDAWQLFTLPGTGEEVAEARRELDDLTARLNSFYEQAADGGLSPSALAAIEKRLDPQIEQARRRSQPPAIVPTPVRELPGPAARERWEQLPIGLQRETVQLVMSLRLGKTYRGARSFDRWRLAHSRWTGDEKTWGERWAEQGLAPARRGGSPT